MNQVNKGGRGLACTERNEQIRAMFPENSVTHIAELFNLSKSRIVQILNPEKTKQIEADKRKRARECGE